MRFALLRSTASWKLFLETTTPAMRSAPGVCKCHPTRRRPLTERPRSKILLYLTPGRRVDIKQVLKPESDACVLSRGEPREPYAHPSSLCERDIRFSFSA
jgi:hypothetical protein